MSSNEMVRITNKNTHALSRLTISFVILIFYKNNKNANAVLHLRVDLNYFTIASFGAGEIISYGCF